METKTFYSKVFDMEITRDLNFLKRYNYCFCSIGDIKGKDAVRGFCTNLDSLNEWFKDDTYTKNKWEIINLNDVNILY